MVEAHTFLRRGGPLWHADRQYQAEREEPAPRTIETYVCPRQHAFQETFSADIEDAEVPLVWRCPRHGADSKRLGYENMPLPPVPYGERQRGDDGRTHYDRLLERRPISELEALLDERLAELARRRT